MKKLIILFGVFPAIALLINFASAANLTNPKVMIWGKSIERTENTDYFMTGENKKFYGTLDFEGQRIFYQGKRKPYYYVDILDFNSALAAREAIFSAIKNSKNDKKAEIILDEIMFAGAEDSGFGVMWRDGQQIYQVVAPSIGEVQEAVEALGY